MNLPKTKSRYNAWFLCLIFNVLAAYALCAGGTHKIASTGDRVSGPMFTAISYTREDGTSVTVPASPWPKGVYDLVNDRLRTETWTSWFTGLPNDVEDYYFVVKSHGELKHVLQKFLNIKSASLRVCLSARQSKASCEDAFSTAAAVFSIGNQVVYEHWQKTTRTKGTSNSIALPPTLTLYCGNPFVDLSRVSIPPDVELVTDVQDATAESPEEAATVARINKFLDKHPAQSSKMPHDLATSSSHDQKSPQVATSPRHEPKPLKWVFPGN